MRRSDPLRSDPDKLRAWQNRSRRNLPRAGRLRQRSPRKKDRYDAIADACGEAIRRDGRCVAAGLVPSVCCSGPLDPQHLWPRLVAPAQVANPEAIVACCRAHHSWIDANPEAANAVGLHGFTGDTLADLAERRESAQNRPLRRSEPFG